MAQNKDKISFKMFFLMAGFFALPSCDPNREVDLGNALVVQYACSEQTRTAAEYLGCTKGLGLVSQLSETDPLKMGEAGLEALESQCDREFPVSSLKEGFVSNSPVGECFIATDLISAKGKTGQKFSAPSEKNYPSFDRALRSCRLACRVAACEGMKNQKYLNQSVDCRADLVELGNR